MVLLASALLALPALVQTDGWEKRFAEAKALLNRGAVAEAIGPLTDVHASHSDLA